MCVWRAEGVYQLLAWPALLKISRIPFLRWCYQVIPGHHELMEVHVDTARVWLLELCVVSPRKPAEEEEECIQLVLSSHARMSATTARPVAWNNSPLVTVECEIYTMCTSYRATAQVWFIIQPPWKLFFLCVCVCVSSLQSWPSFWSKLIRFNSTRAGCKQSSG